MSPVKALIATSDPMDATSRHDFARLLRALMQERRRSADSVARRSRYAGMPISRATVYNLIAAEGVPRRETVLGFLRGCGLPAHEQIRWLVTFDRLYPTGRRTPSPS